MINVIEVKITFVYNDRRYITYKCYSEELFKALIHDGRNDIDKDVITLNAELQYALRIHIPALVLGDERYIEDYDDCGYERILLPGIEAKEFELANVDAIIARYKIFTVKTPPPDSMEVDTSGVIDFENREFI